MYYRETCRKSLA